MIASELVGHIVAANGDDTMGTSFVIGSAKRGTSSKFSFLNKYNF